MQCGLSGQTAAEEAHDQKHNKGYRQSQHGQSAIPDLRLRSNATTPSIEFITRNLFQERTAIGSGFSCHGAARNFVSNNIKENLFRTAAPPLAAQKPDRAASGRRPLARSNSFGAPETNAGQRPLQPWRRCPCSKQAARNTRRRRPSRLGAASGSVNDD